MEFRKMRNFRLKRRKMRKNASQSRVSQAPKPSQNTNPVDDALAEHLRQAEHHLIEAINLFSRPRGPIREVTYLRRLTEAQEAITWLYRKELVRIRGPLKPARKSRRPRKR